MWHKYVIPANLDEALQVLAEQGEQARLVAGATDLMLEMERKVRRGIKTLVDITRLPSLDQIIMDEHDIIHLGPLVTHNQCVESRLIREFGLPLAQAAWEVGAPQIRNRGTVAGNLITASPANDTITPLMALNAKVHLRSQGNERSVPLSDFYLGVRQTVMRPDEMLVDISLPAMKSYERGIFIKLGLRRAQAISLVNAAVVLELENPRRKAGELAQVAEARITLGAVAPTIIHAEEAEYFLKGKSLDEAVIEQAATLAMQAAHPIDDLRSSADYRQEIVRVCVRRSLRTLAAGEERAILPEQIVLLAQPSTFESKPLPGVRFEYDAGAPIETTINGKAYTFTSGYHKSLLRLLREEAGLIGTKEGCAEGECGACTVILDGVAVMSCLVPAPRAHHAHITTIEGLAQSNSTGQILQLHPLQQAFIEKGAVQCGYCTPGILMSAAALLAETPQPTRSQIEQALTGNLCRCTGYYKIIEAIEAAAQVDAAKPVTSL